MKKKKMETKNESLGLYHGIKSMLEENNHDVDETLVRILNLISAEGCVTEEIIFKILHFVQACGYTPDLDKVLRVFDEMDKKNLEFAHDFCKIMKENK